MRGIFELGDSDDVFLNDISSTMTRTTITGLRFQSTFLCIKLEMGYPVPCRHAKVCNNGRNQRNVVADKVLSLT